MHPSPSVGPLVLEPVLESDGATRNDCERQAASRLFPGGARRCASTPEDGGVAGCVGGDRGASAAVSGVGHALSDRGQAGLACAPVRLGSVRETRASGSRTIAREGISVRPAAAAGVVSDVPLNATHRDTVRVTVLQVRGRRRPRVAPRGRRGHGCGSRACAARPGSLRRRKFRVVYKFVCKNEKRTVTTDEWLESDVLSGMWRCLDAIPHPGANHS